MRFNLKHLLPPHYYLLMLLIGGLMSLKQWAARFAFWGHEAVDRLLLAVRPMKAQRLAKCGCEACTRDLAAFATCDCPGCTTARQMVGMPEPETNGEVPSCEGDAASAAQAQVVDAFVAGELGEVPSCEGDAASAAQAQVVDAFVAGELMEWEKVKKLFARHDADITAERVTAWMEDETTTVELRAKIVQRLLDDAIEFPAGAEWLVDCCLRLIERQPSAHAQLQLLDAVQAHAAPDSGKFACAIEALSEKARHWWLVIYHPLPSLRTSEGDAAIPF